jgi:hypothetical protein
MVAMNFAVKIELLWQKAGVGMLREICEVVGKSTT